MGGVGGVFFCACCECDVSLKKLKCIPNVMLFVVILVDGGVFRN